MEPAWLLQPHYVDQINGCDLYICDIHFWTSIKKEECYQEITFGIIVLKKRIPEDTLRIAIVSREVIYKWKLKKIKTNKKT